ncbi:MAG: sensor histidine kinase [Lachnospirales bacterium]
MNLRKRLYRSLYFLAALSIVATTLIATLFFYFQVINKDKMELQNKANIISYVVNHTENAEKEAYLYDISLIDKSMRITYINTEGYVAYDSYANINTLENHNDRPEVINAKTNGYAEDTRFSSSINKSTYYYAVLLDNGYVLRLSKNTAELGFFFLKSGLPIILALLIFCISLANWGSKKIAKFVMEPINSFNFDEIENYESEIYLYDELSPFISKIQYQRKKILSQIDKINNHKETIEKIIENIDEGLIITDKNATVLSSNKYAKDFFNEGILGQDIRRIERTFTFITKVNESLKGVSSTLEIEKNNRKYVFHFIPSKSEETIKGTIILIFDITEKIFFEQQRKEFTANVSHELKTPLTVISGLSELMNNNLVPSEDIKSFSEKIYKESQNLLSLIEDIIKISEFDEKNVIETKLKFDFSKVTKTVGNNLYDFSKQNNIKIFSNIDDNIYFFGVERMIEEVIYNLIANAIKYNKENGFVFISLREKNNKIIFTVADDGIGISDEQQKLVFQRFYRVDKSRSKKIKGTGLGLAIVKHSVEYHEGVINLESDLNKGTSINIFF